MLSVPFSLKNHSALTPTLKNTQLPIPADIHWATLSLLDQHIYCTQILYQPGFLLLLKSPQISQPLSPCHGCSSIISLVSSAFQYSNNITKWCDETSSFCFCFHANNEGIVFLGITVRVHQFFEMQIVNPPLLRQSQETTKMKTKSILIVSSSSARRLKVTTILQGWALRSFPFGTLSSFPF